MKSFKAVLTCIPFFTTSFPKPSTSGLPRAQALDGPGISHLRQQPPVSPALSTASTADGDNDADLESSPSAPKLPAPKLPERATALLRSPTRPNDELFETASWGSPYPPHDRNVRRQSFSSDLSEESPIHHLDIATPFLRPTPQFLQQPDTEIREPLSAAAAVLANRVRRSNRGLTEDWIRAHTAAGEGNIEPRLWLSDGSDSEHSSLSGSELAWLGELTPRAVKAAKAAKKQTRQPRASASIETLKPSEGKGFKLGNSTSMASEPELMLEPASKAPPQRDQPAGQSVEDGHKTPPAEHAAAPTSMAPSESSDGVADAPKKSAAETLAPVPIPSTPKRLKEKPLPKEPPMTPRIKKKVPWKGKNIMILVPRDDGRGKPGKTPMPLRPDETERMFASWKELGYSVDGFDLIADDYHHPGTDDAQSRDCWPSAEELIKERSTGHYQVTLPDLNAWKNYVQELQEAKLRALGVSDATEDPHAPAISPSLTLPSRQASAQYPPLPFSPPIPTSSASSNPGFNFQSQLLSGTTTTTQSPGITSPIPFGHVQGKFNPRQSISLPTGSSPFQMSHVQGWQNQAGILQSLARIDSPLLNLNGIVSPQSPYDLDGFPLSGSPALNAHHRHQSLQYFPQQMARASPHLQQVREDDEEDEEDYAKSPSKTPEPPKPQQVEMQAEMQDAQYHLEEQLRNQLEHEDYNPQTQGNSATNHENLASVHDRQASGNLAVSEHFANDQAKPIVLHHPRPHSRGQSLTQTFFRDHEAQADGSDFGRLNGIPESNKPEGDEAYEIETNPSNLGTPVQNFDFPAMLHQHQQTMSSASNPWNNANESVELSDQERKISTSKLNVKAPEFKFNPTSNFTPGGFNFSSASTFQPGAASFQPAIFQAGVEDYVEPGPHMTEFGSSALGMTASFPSFAPSQSKFSFSTSGPKFRPDAPSFTPFRPLVNSLNKSGKGHQGRTDSIFGEINIDTSEIVHPIRTSKAIPIVRPSSRSSAKSPLLGVAEWPNDEIDSDGRPVQDESRAKRARSLAPENQDIASFAQMPLASISESTHDKSLFIDTSVSSAGTADVVETKHTTVVPQETLPSANNDEEWQPLQTVKDAVINSHKAQHSAELKAKKQAHKRNSLSATAIPFSPGALSYGEESPSTLTRAEPSPVKMTYSGSISDLKKTTPKISDESQFSSPIPSAKPKGLKASRFAQPELQPAPASLPEPRPEEIALKNTSANVMPSIEAQDTLVELGEEPVETDAKTDEPTFEEIDAVMQQMETDPSMGVKKKPLQKSMWNQTSPIASRQSSYTSRAVVHDFVPQFDQPVPPYPKESQLEDPFIDPPDAWDNEQQHVGMPASDWEGAFSEDEHSKLENRTQFFDGRVNEIVGSLLASRLEPMEKTLLSIQSTLGSKSHRAPSSRLEIRSTTGENQESDADDEDDELIIKRSMSPRRDRRMDQIRVAITEALALQQQHVQPATEAPAVDYLSILTALEEMKQHISTLKNTLNVDRELGDGHAEDMRRASKSDDAILAKLDQLQTKNIDLEQRLQFEQHKIEKEVQERREAEDAAAELSRKLNAAETRVEVEIINKSVYDQRVGDLEERLRLQEEKTEEQLKQRRLLEDKLCDVQRQLKHASEEESRLTETLEDRDRRVKELEQAAGKKAMRMTLLEAASNNASQSQSEMTNKLNALEGDLKEVRQDNTHWRTEAERAEENARRNAGELAVVRDENKSLQNFLQTLTAQLQENERLRESWRGKFMSLQEDMANAAREVAEESARRIKKDQAMLARQEVLDARLQAEAKTRERLEVEMERLQTNERSGMRALNECTRLEGIVGQLRTEKDKLQQTASRYQREFEEARESGASEVKRTRMALQTEIDAANHQVNIVRRELEDQNAKLRAEIDNIRLEADTAKERNEMLLEGEQTSKAQALDELQRKHQNEIEDMQTRYERQIGNAAEDNQRSEEALLERLSLSSSKIEHLKDRILHLEDKLEISKQAAAAAAQAAKVAGVESAHAAAPGAAPGVTNRTAIASKLPEKISPQALRESIMVLQEQLQAREQRIEELEQDVAKLDPEASSKISKRDDEISWLRELLAVRHSDLQDIIATLAIDSFDRERVKDAAIRLKANLQMEEQERERAMNGGSAITLPNIAQSIQAATPRVAQTIGSSLNAFDRWRKSSHPSFLAGVLNSPSAGPASTPSRSKGPSVQQSKLLSGLLTPPASGLRQTPTADGKPQPTAFASTGRRFPSNGSANNRPRGESESSALVEEEGYEAPADTTPRRRQEQPADPVTPPMIRQSGYDSDAQPGDFDDHDFFED